MTLILLESVGHYAPPLAVEKPPPSPYRAGAGAMSPPDNGWCVAEAG